MLGFHPLSLFSLVLAALLSTATCHEHDKQHSHFCEGTGHSVYCPEGHTLRIDRAWYGRIAHDTSCVISRGDDSNTTSSHDLAEDCGASILDSKSTWCQTPEKDDTGGCIIQVTPDLAPKMETKPCPEGVTKYLYLEYECLERSGGARVAVLSRVGAAVVVVLSSLMSLGLSF